MSGEKNGEEILDSLRSQRRVLSPVELAELLDRLTGGRLSQGTLITYFKQAFPDLPLRVLLDCGAWTRLSDGGMTDAEFNAILGPLLQAGD